jgi:catechol 2,3-dioxygenase-like lactoylglutathione lyase family enzyme
MQLTGVCIGAADLPAAVASYALLLGVPGVPLAGGGTRFVLGRGCVDVAAGPPGLHAVRFSVREDEAAPRSAHGVTVVGDPEPSPPPGPEAVAIDHVVVHTVDPDRAIALWRDDLGVRLALDRAFPARGLRLLFFRSGGITLEYASPLPARGGPAGDDRLHGVSYRVTDLAAGRDRLLAAGLDVSPLRPGMRPGTTVATVRSGTAGVPTLLLEIDAASPLTGPEPRSRRA